MFGCLYLDNRHRLVATETLFRGTIDGASVHPREVVKAALGHNAAAIIAYHNHPSGSWPPSQADELITRRLKEALALVEIRLAGSSDRRRIDLFVCRNGTAVVPVRRARLAPGVFFYWDDCE